MYIFAILLTSFFEQRKWLVKLRGWFNEQLLHYVNFFTKIFTKRIFSTPGELRFIYIFACAPIVVILLLLKLILLNHWFILTIIDLVLFMLTVEILTWKKDAKSDIVKNNDHRRAFITKYATNFFAALFWFIVLPSAIGSICYLIITLISHQLKNHEAIINNMVTDKMLFYLNVIPYTLLFIFIAIAGNFEEVTHYMLEQRKNYTKSFFFLENMLNEIILIAIGKSKFQTLTQNTDDIEAGSLINEKFTPQITTYVIAILYRAGIFFVGMLAIISIATWIN